MCVGACSGQKKVFNPIKLEFQEVNELTDVDAGNILGIVLRASKRSK